MIVAIVKSVLQFYKISESGFEGNLEKKFQWLKSQVLWYSFKSHKCVHKVQKYKICDNCNYDIVCLFLQIN